MRKYVGLVVDVCLYLYDRFISKEGVLALIGELAVGVAPFAVILVERTVGFTESVFSIGEYSETYRYAYEGDYLVTTEDVGDYHYNLTWKDGDLVQVVCIFDLGPISNTEYSFKYSSDENLFVDGINPLFQIIEDETILFGLAGKHSAHLPTELTKKDFNGEMVKTYESSPTMRCSIWPSTTSTCSTISP